MAGFGLSINRLDFACTLLLGFSAFLRTGELLRVRRSHILLGSADSLVVLLPLTKVSRRRGAPER
eukprot:1491177-Amphidinium_carterae.1